MNNFDKLLFNKKAKEVIKITENQKDYISLSYRLKAFIIEGLYQKALDLIENNRKTLEKKLPFLMQIHFDILFDMKLIEKAKKEYKYYENLPYFSMEVEELLINIKKRISEKENEIHKFQSITLEELKENLVSNNSMRILGSVDYIVKNGLITAFLKQLEIILKKYSNDIVKTYVLFALVDQRIDKDFVLKKDGKTIIVNPSKLFAPFEKNHEMNVRRHFKDPSLANVAVELLNRYIIAEYPERIDLSSPYLYKALEIVSDDYLGIKKEENKVYDEKTDNIIKKIYRGLKLYDSNSL